MMSKAEELYTRMHYLPELTNEEILELGKEIDAFFESDEPEEDKQELAGYTEGFNMVCNAINEGYLKDRKPSKPKVPKKQYTFELEIPEFLKRKIKENEEKAVASIES